MMQQQTSIPEMFNQSMDVITNPNVTTFERYERRGTVANAAIYVGIAALIAALLGGIAGGLWGVLGGLLNTLVGFFLFTGLVYYIGKQQGGTGTFDEVAYTFSLFYAPLSLVVPILGLLTAIPLLGWLVVPVWFISVFVVIIALIYFAYIAVQSSMNIRNQSTAVVTLGTAAVSYFLIQLLIAIIF